jgi:hypothetical protein
MVGLLALDFQFSNQCDVTCSPMQGLAVAYAGSAVPQSSFPLLHFFLASISSFTDLAL